jgi:hypothetical protein
MPESTPAIERALGAFWRQPGDPPAPCPVVPLVRRAERRVLPPMPIVFGGSMPLPKTFQNFAEFERDFLRGENRIGLSLEEMVEDTSFEAELELDDPLECDDDDDEY